MALSFGERVALIRRRRGLTQGQLATLLGVSGNTVSRIEQSTHSTWGFEDVKGKTVAALARHLQISADYLLGLSEDDRDMAWGPEPARDGSGTLPPPPKRQRTPKAAPVV